MTVYVDNLLFSCWQQRVPAPASICVIALPRRFAGQARSPDCVEHWRSQLSMLSVANLSFSLSHDTGVT
ncbi:hypothetical protein AXM73_22385 [Salmonella enterica subsp. enterica]|nr:hypothetical protein [Salmonella enterica]EAW1744627.1 hypothetical protein [Salmonella enterica subsp. enterica]ECD5201988.1 hypothetical protein [Salmonella enterica subsp. enterica serovar Reading]ECV7800668.1 hypothetical protein [Salmonella enterica subsp. enterica serovar Brandenburg]EGV8158560.1 hypothetical protein [Salmonella enterica]